MHIQLVLHIAMLPLVAQKECIPVGCVPPAAVAVSWEGVCLNACWDTHPVDPVHLFLSLSSETEFRWKPLPIALLTVACMNINLL